MENLFEKASRHKLRFKIANGQVSIEDLWDLNLEALDKIAKALNSELKDSEESFIKKKSTKSTLSTWKFELVKYVIDVKLAEEEEGKIKVERAAKKKQLLELINRKELQSLENKSIEDLTKELEAL